MFRLTITQTGTVDRKVTEHATRAEAEAALAAFAGSSRITDHTITSASRPGGVQQASHTYRIDGVADQLSFGARWLVPDDAVAAWGARAIDHGTDIDIPWDRTSVAGSDADRQRLLAIASEADPVAAYRNLAAQIGITPDSPIMLAQDTGDGFAAAAERRGGYVYLAAWITG